MKRKNLFLFPILILISTLCFINVSCFSGFQEKGELSITFTESTIRQIMARGADISEEQEGFEFDPTENAYAYYIGATSGLSETFTLYVYNDLSYKVYSSKLISSIAADLEEKFKNLTTEDYLSNPKLLEMFKNPLALYEDAIVSKGTWAQSGSSILITETHYMSAASGKLTEVSNPSVIATIPQDAKYFTVQSNSGYVITFYTSTKEDDYYDDEPVDSAKLLVRVVVGNIAYEKTLTVYSNTKAAHVEFTDLPVGVTARVSALVYFDHLGEEREIYAKGESEEFVIQAGTNTATINLKLYEGYEEDDPADLIPPSGTIVDCFSNKTTDSSENSYILVLYDTQYSVYEFSPDVREEHKDEIAFSADTTKEDIIRIISGILKYGNVVSFGKYTYTVNSQNAYNYSYTEQAYYDSDSQKFRSSKYGGNSTGDVKYLTIYLGSVAGWKKEFVPYSFKSSDESTQNFTFMISGYEMNDFLDLGKNTCYVRLYEINDAAVMQTIKSTLANDKITDAKKAEVLIPIIEDSEDYIFRTFEPGKADSNFTNEILDDGTIKWSGTCLPSVEEGETYGVLATVYFSKTSYSGFYEFGIGFTGDLTYSAESNEVELTVSGMNIPCNINFYYDNELDSELTVQTALTEIMLIDDNLDINESVLNEIFSAAADSVAVLEEKDYEFNSNYTPDYGFENGVPFVNLYYIYNPEQGGDDPIDEPDDPVEETPTTNVDVELEESASNLTELNLSYTSSTDEYGQNCYIVSLDETNPDISGYNLTWKIDGVAKNETGSQLIVYDALLSIGKHSVVLTAVSPDGKKICAGNTSINITREKESRVAFVSTERGIEFRVNRFTTDKYFENMELVEAESNISVKTEFETSLSGWTGYWPFVEPNKEYTFILKGKIGESTAIEEYYQVPVEYKGTRNSPITEEVLSNIKQFKQQAVNLSSASGDACVSYEQSSGKELTNMFASIQGVTVSSSHLQLDLYEQTDKGWNWYTLCEYSENGFIPDSISEIGVIENSEEWGKTNALENIQDGAQLFVTMQPVYVLNGDNSQYFEIDYLTSNTITYEK